MNDDVWLIVPLFNEGAVIRDVVEDARQVFSNIVCVDDGSVDDSGAQAFAGGALVVRHPINLGQGAAIQTGLDYARAQQGSRYFVTFDSDGQHQAADALAMVNRLRSGDVDIVLGSRFLDDRTDVGPIKKVVLKVAVAFSNATTGVHLSDAHNGLRALNRVAARSLQIKQDRMAHASEIVEQIGKCGLRYAEYPVHIHYSDYSRNKGQSLLNSVNIMAELLYK